MKDLINEKPLSSCSRGGALVVAILIGVFGIHRFYVGKVGSGIFMILFTISGFLTWVSLIWVIVDILRIALGEFQDSDGLVIKNW